MLKKSKHAVNIIVIFFICLTTIQITYSEEISKKRKAVEGRYDFETLVTGQYANYYFVKDSVLTNTKMIELVNRYDKILAFSKNNLNLSFDYPTIYILDKADKTTIASKKIVLYPDANSVSAVIYYASSNCLPAWLCSGIGLYCFQQEGLLDNKYNTAVDIKEWIKNQEKKGLASFGDAWFYPGFINATDKTKLDAEIISLQFINFTVNNGQLSKLVNAVKVNSNNGSNFDKDIQDAWHSFAGKDVPDIDCNVRYTYEEEQALIIYGSQQDYYLYEDAWTWEFVQKCIKEIEESREYVVKWLNVEYTGKFKVKMYQEMEESGGTGHYKDSVIYLYACREYFGIATVHEMVHAIVDKTMTVKEPFTIFEDGLAELVEIAHEKEKPGMVTEMYTADMQEMYFTENYDPIFNMNSFKSFYNLKNGEPYKNGDKVNLQVYYDSFARAGLQNAEHKIGGRLRLPYLADQKYNLGITLYCQAESFAAYLYEKYGKEKLIEANCNVNDVYKIYGKRIETLVEEWKESLRIWE